jgi:hypothetical protein
MQQSDIDQKKNVTYITMVIAFYRRFLHFSRPRVWNDLIQKHAGSSWADVKFELGPRTYIPEQQAGWNIKRGLVDYGNPKDVVRTYYEEKPRHHRHDGNPKF